MYFPLPLHSDSHLQSESFVMSCKNRGKIFWPWSSCRDLQHKHFKTNSQTGWTCPCQNCVFFFFFAKMFCADVPVQCSYYLHCSVHWKWVLSVRKCSLWNLWRCLFLFHCNANKHSKGSIPESNSSQSNSADSESESESNSKSDSDSKNWSKEERRAL